MLSKRGRSINSNIQKVFGYWYIHCRDRSSQVKGLFYTIFCKGLLFISFAFLLDFFWHMHIIAFRHQNKYYFCESLLIRDFRKMPELRYFALAT